HARMAQEQELVVDPAFFTALQAQLPQISHVEIQLKRGRHLNELTRFRYDVTLYVGGAAPAAEECAWVDWRRDQLMLAVVPELLGTAPTALGVTRLPNARLAREMRALALLARADGPATAGALREALADTGDDGAIDPEALWALGEQQPYEV